MDSSRTPIAAAPPAPRHRHNGWTAERQAGFIHALGDTASVSAAAAHVGMTRQSAYWLRRQPAATDFRAAWDAAVALAWRQVEASALERVVNGETEIWDRDGVQVIRHRPCTPYLVVHMMDRAVAAREKAEAATAEAHRVAIASSVERVRAEIRALADPDHRPDPDRPPRTPPVIEDALTHALRRLDELVGGFVDRGAAPAPAPETSESGKDVK